MPSLLAILAQTTMSNLLVAATEVVSLALTLQEVDPAIPVEDPMWWPRGSWLLLTGIALALLIAFIVWVLRNPPGAGGEDADRD